jgi:hypothetical protein
MNNDKKKSGFWLSALICVHRRLQVFVTAPGFAAAALKILAADERR